MGRYQIDIIEDYSVFATLEHSWNELLQLSSSNSIFLTWEWAAAWLRAARSRVRPVIAAAKDAAGRLVGIAPFYRSRMQVAHILPVGCLRLIGDYRSGSEYPDLIVSASCDPGVRVELLEGLMRSESKWDCIWLPRVASWTGAAEQLAASLRDAGFHLHTRPSSFSSVPLPSSIDAYLSGLSRNQRSAVRRQHRKILAQSDVQLKCHREPTQLRRCLDALYRLHAMRWNAVGQTGGFVRSGAKEFYEEFLPISMERGWGRFHTLEVAGVIKAVQVGYVYNNTFHQLQEGFDPQYSDGAGNALRLHAIESCIQEGIAQYDFLGGHTDHKRRWGAVERFGIDLFAGRRSLKTLLLFQKEIWPSGRFINEKNPVEASLVSTNNRGNHA